MRLSSYLFSLLLAATGPAAFAQSSREAAEAHTLYEKANTDPTGQALRDALARQPAGFYGGENLQPGALRTFDGRYRPVPGLRYHAGLRLLEAQDSINLADAPLARRQPARLRPGRARRQRPRRPAALPPAPGEGRPRRHPPRLCRSAHRRRCRAAAAGLALLLGTDAPAGRLSAAPMLVVGPGTEANAPLRPLDLSQSGVLQLFGKRAENVSGYAMRQELKYTGPRSVAKMIDYYNSGRW